MVAGTSVTASAGYDGYEDRGHVISVTPRKRISSWVNLFQINVSVQLASYIDNIDNCYNKCGKHNRRQY